MYFFMKQLINQQLASFNTHIHYSKIKNQWVWQINPSHYTNNLICIVCLCIQLSILKIYFYKNIQFKLEKPIIEFVFK